MSAARPRLSAGIPGPDPGRELTAQRIRQLGRHQRSGLGQAIRRGVVSDSPEPVSRVVDPNDPVVDVQGNGGAAETDLDRPVRERLVVQVSFRIPLDSDRCGSELAAPFFVAMCCRRVSMAV